MFYRGSTQIIFFQGKTQHKNNKNTKIKSFHKAKDASISEKLIDYHLKAMKTKKKLRAVRETNMHI